MPVAEKPFLVVEGGVGVSVAEGGVVVLVAVPFPLAEGAVGAPVAEGGISFPQIWGGFTLLVSCRGVPLLEGFTFPIGEKEETLSIAVAETGVA